MNLSGIHFLNDLDGHVVRMVDDCHQVQHGGGANGRVENAWADLADINNQAIGVENVHKEGAEYPQAQITSLIGLIRRARELYPAIALNHVVGHCDVYTGKAECPGPKFPWEQLEAAGVSLGPTPLTDPELDRGWGGFAGDADPSRRILEGRARTLEEGDEDRQEADGSFSVLRKGRVYADGLSVGPVALLNQCLHRIGDTPNRAGRKVADFATWSARYLHAFTPGTDAALKFFRVHYCTETRPNASSAKGGGLDYELARLVLGGYWSLLVPSGFMG